MNTPKYFVPMNQGYTFGFEGRIGVIVSEQEGGYLVDFNGEQVFKAYDQGYPAANKREANILVRAAKEKVR